MMRLIKIAVLDLYDGTENEGMRCIQDILKHFQKASAIEMEWTVFDVRQKLEIPDLDFDIYISSGGPGSPLADENNTWEGPYFQLIEQLVNHNLDEKQNHKKYVFFICHSFQLACRYFKVATVSKRKSMAFGVFPVHMFEQAASEPCFKGLADPFFVVDSRYYQITQPDYMRIETLGAQILCIEKERAHIPLERAIMAMRFNPYMIGTQFHPEVDAEGMRLYLLKDEHKQTVIKNHGIEKWISMLEHLDDPDKIRWTYAHILPNFLNQSIQQLHGT